MARKSRRSVRNHLPLRPSILHILLALSEVERHGYAIKQAVESSTEGIVRMGPGTLYESLQRLEADALVREVRPPASELPHSQRRYYALSPLGRSVLAAELQRLSEIVERAQTGGVLGKEAT